MPFDWPSKDTDTMGQAEKVPAGFHKLTIDRIVTGPKDGAPFKSSKGDPQIMLIFTDLHGCEAASMVTLSAKAAWVLAKLMSRLGINLERLKNEGIDPSHFADAKFAEKVLLRKTCWCHVKWKPGTDGKEYADITPYHEHELPPGTLLPAPGMDDDLPF